MRSMRLLGCIAFVLLLISGPAAIAAAPAEDKVLAKHHFESGARHYDLSEWDQALVEFKEAYRLKPDAIFLYNIAQCHRKLGHVDDALTFYKTYLRRAPDAPNREEVERRIAELEAERQAQQARQAEEQRVALAEREAKAATEAKTAAEANAAAEAKAAAEARAAADARAAASAQPAPVSPAAPAPSLASVPPSAEPSPNRADLTQTVPAPSEGQPEPSIFSRWWFWTAVGVVAAGAVTTGLLLSRGSSSKPFCPDCVNSVDVNLP